MKVQVKFKPNGANCINIHTYFNVRGVHYVKDEEGEKLLLLYPISKMHEIRLNSQVEFIDIDEFD